MVIRTPFIPRWSIGVFIILTRTELKTPYLEFEEADRIDADINSYYRNLKTPGQWRESISKTGIWIKQNRCSFNHWTKR